MRMRGSGCGSVLMQEGEGFIGIKAVVVQRFPTVSLFLVDFPTFHF